MKQRIFSGIQPSGNLHIGNYLGAISQFVALQDQFDCVFCVVDLHAITVKQDPEQLRSKIIEIAKIYLASGIDPVKSIIFQQSDVSAHAELGWILNCVARMSDLHKMTQFKDKSGDDQINASVGLFDYPVLMAADILLYDTKVVPVGEDQVQHVELTRDLARRFNHQFGQTFIEPEARLMKQGARIMGLDDPTKKMSKSAASEYNYVALTDDPDKAAKKIMRAETDSGSEVKFDEKNKPGISNLLNIYSLMSGKAINNLEKEFMGKGYGDFKKVAAEEVKSFLIKFQSKYNNISDSAVKAVLDEGAKRAKPVAEAKFVEVEKKVGMK